MTKVYYLLQKSDGSLAVSLSHVHGTAVVGMAASLDSAKQLLADMRTDPHRKSNRLEEVASCDANSR